jgi:leader peptidase (prepilin peptidase)/N-methyltransferase
MAVSWIGAVFYAPETPSIAPSVFLFFYLSLLSWFDFKYWRLPNNGTIPLIGLGIVHAHVSGGSLALSISGAAVGYSVIWTIAAWWKQVRKKDGIGMGNAKLLAAAGAWNGLISLPYLVLIASVSGLLWTYTTKAHLTHGNKVRGAIPFGPFIVLGFWLVWLWH